MLFYHSYLEHFSPLDIYKVTLISTIIEGERIPFQFFALLLNVSRNMMPEIKCAQHKRTILNVPALNLSKFKFV